MCEAAVVMMRAWLFLTMAFLLSSSTEIVVSCESEIPETPSSGLKDLPLRGAAVYTSYSDKGPTVFLLGKGSTLELAREARDGPIRGMFRLPGRHREYSVDDHHAAQGIK